MSGHPGRPELKSADLIDVLSDQFVLRGVPEHIRSDNGPEFVAKAVRDWIGAVGAKTAYIERGSPWENGFIESFNARLRDERSMAKSSTPCAKPRSSSKVGGATSMQSGRMNHSAHRRCAARTERRVAAPVPLHADRGDALLDEVIGPDARRAAGYMIRPRAIGERAWVAGREPSAPRVARSARPACR